MSIMKTDLTGKTVIHRKFGDGVVIAHDKDESQATDIIRVDFSGSKKSFKYPEAFQGFLQVKDDDIKKMIGDDLEILKQSAERKKEKEESPRMMTIDAKNDTKKPVVHRPERKQYNIDKKYPRKNIALKCNYNDGGRNNSRIGYCGVCSDPVIRHNIVDKKRSWCSNPDCSCKQYIDRKISRRELDSQCENGGWGCYESQMLREWRAWAGQSISRGTVTENMRFQSVRRNSLAILTTRKPKSKEADRFIFAVFLVDDFWEGDEKEEGCVSSNSIYRLAFSEKECRELLFWNYYSNKTRTEKPLWGVGTS